MKTLSKILVVAGCSALAWAATAGVSEGAQQQATTTAVVVLPITMTTQTHLNFGKFMSGASGGTVVVSTAGAQSVTGGVTSSGTMGSTATAATFNISGEPSTTYAVTFPAQTALTRFGGGGTDMTIGTFTTASSGTLGQFSGATDTLSVGATLTVGASQMSGTYNGTLDVAVNYN